MTFDRYDIKYIKDFHIYEFKDNKFKNIKRNKFFEDVLKSFNNK